MDKYTYGLPQTAFENAHAKGFWPLTILDLEGGSVYVVGAKLALVATEIMEAQQARYEELRYEFIEELCDIVIRISDIFGYYGWKYHAGTFENYDQNNLRSFDNLLHDYYGLVAMATQEHRKGNHLSARDYLNAIVTSISTAVSVTYGDDVLSRAIEAKMDKNKTRPMLHGRRY